MQLILGIGIVLVCVFGGFMLHGGSMAVIWQPVELLIICGAALGALVLGNPKHVLVEMLGQIKRIVMRKKHGAEFQRQLLLLMYELLITASQGLKALDEHVESPRQSPLFNRYPLVLQQPKLLAFIVDNFRLMAMGKINAHELEGVLDQEIDAIHEELNQPSKSLHKIGEDRAERLDIIPAQHRVMVTIRPRRASTMPGRNAWQQLNTPLRFVPRYLFHSPGSSSQNSEEGRIWALGPAMPAFWPRACLTQ